MKVNKKISPCFCRTDKLTDDRQYYDGARIDRDNEN